MAIKIHVNESTNTGLVKALSEGLERLVGKLQEEFPLLNDHGQEYGVAISGSDPKVNPVTSSRWYDADKADVVEVVSDVFARNMGDDILDSNVTYNVRFETAGGDEFFARVKVFTDAGDEDILGLDRIRFDGDVDYAVDVISKRIVEDLDERIPDNSAIRDYNGRTK